MAFRNPIPYPADLPASHFIEFNPNYEYGFRQSSLIKTERTSGFRNLNYMQISDASSMFHNFYGLEADISIRNPQADISIEFAKNLSYQQFAKPYERYKGGQVYQTDFLPRQNQPRLGGFAELYSTTNQMYKFYSQPNGLGNFLGFGQFLFRCGVGGDTTSFGGTMAHFVQISTWEVGQEDLPEYYNGLYRVRNPDPEAPEGEEYITVNAFDGSYQKYFFDSQMQAADPLYRDPRLVPQVDASLTYRSFNLRDNNGNNIPFKITESKIGVTTFDPIILEDDAGERYIDRIADYPPPISKIDIKEGGLFYKYVQRGNENIGNFEPNGFPLF